MGRDTFGLPPFPTKPCVRDTIQRVSWADPATIGPPLSTPAPTTKIAATPLLPANASPSPQPATMRRTTTQRKLKIAPNPDTAEMNLGLLHTANTYNEVHVPPHELPSSTLQPRDLPSHDFRFDTAPTLPPSPAYCTPMSMRPECQSYVRRFRRW